MLKLLAATTVAVALVAVAGVPATPTLLLTLVLLVAALALRTVWGTVATWPGAPSVHDATWLAVAALPLTFAPVVLAMAITGRWDAALLVAVVTLAAGGRWLPRWRMETSLTPARGAETASEVTIPTGVYWLAAVYVVWSVAAPFGHFNENSLVREMYTDGFQRFGVVHALMEQVPPRNPFVDGMPLRYYWFSLAPIAALADTGAASPFAAWKVLLTWQAFAFVLALWWVARALTGHAAAAWTATLLAMVLPSAEILWHPSLASALALVTSPAHWPDAVALLTAIDPDHIVGVLVPHSDQVLMEDFLYIPQNAAALLLLLATAWLVTQDRWLAAGWAVALFVGTNTFFVIPGGIALTLVSLVRAGLPRAMLTGAWVAGWGLAWAGLCRITPGWPLTSVGAGIGIAALVFTVWPRLQDQAPRVRIITAARVAGLAVLLGLALLLWQRPVDVWVGLLANYGVAIVLGLASVLMLMAGRGPAAPWAGQVFLTTYIAAFLLATSLLVAPFWIDLPASLTETLLRVGDLVNPFNYYHKAAKGARVAWCLLAAGLAPGVLGWLQQRRTRRALALVATVVVVPIVAATSVLRPLTYLRDEPGAEAAAGALLRGEGATLDTVVLLEDYRWSRINQIAPVSTYFISSWSGGERTLSNAVGTWADQYVPTRLAPEVAARERRNREVFAADDVGAAVTRLRAETRIDYVLTRRRLDLGPAFTLLVDWPGGYLYRAGERGAR